MCVSKIAGFLILFFIFFDPEFVQGVPVADNLKNDIDSLYENLKTVLKEHQDEKFLTLKNFILKAIEKTEGNLSENQQYKIVNAADSIFSKYENSLNEKENIINISKEIARAVRNIRSDKNDPTVAQIGTIEFQQFLLENIKSNEHSLVSSQTLKFFIVDFLLSIKKDSHTGDKNNLNVAVGNIIKKYNFKKKLNEITREVNKAAYQIFMLADVLRNLKTYIQNDLNKEEFLLAANDNIMNTMLIRYPDMPKFQKMLLQHYILHILLKNNFHFKGSQGINYYDISQQIIEYTTINFDKCFQMELSKSNSRLDNLTINFALFEINLLTYISTSLKNINQTHLTLRNKNKLRDMFTDFIYEFNHHFFDVKISRPILQLRVRQYLTKKKIRQPLNFYEVENDIANFLLFKIGQYQLLHKRMPMIRSLLYNENHLGIFKTYSFLQNLNNVTASDVKENSQTTTEDETQSIENITESSADVTSAEVENKFGAETSTVDPNIKVIDTESTESTEEQQSNAKEKVAESDKNIKGSSKDDHETVTETSGVTNQEESESATTEQSEIDLKIDSSTLESSNGELTSTVATPKEQPTAEAVEKEKKNKTEGALNQSQPPSMGETDTSSSDNKTEDTSSANPPIIDSKIDATTSDSKNAESTSTEASLKDPVIADADEIESDSQTVAEGGTNTLSSVKSEDTSSTNPPVIDSKIDATTSDSKNAESTSTEASLKDPVIADADDIESDSQTAAEGGTNTLSSVKTEDTSNPNPPVIDSKIDATTPDSKNAESTSTEISFKEPATAEANKNESDSQPSAGETNEEKREVTGANAPISEVNTDATTSGSSNAESTSTVAGSTGSLATNGTAAENQKVDAGVQLFTDDQLNKINKQITSTAPLADGLKLETTTIESSILETTTPDSANVHGLNVQPPLDARADTAESKKEVVSSGTESSTTDPNKNGTTVSAIKTETTFEESDKVQGEPQSVAETETSTSISKETKETSGFNYLLINPNNNAPNNGSKIVAVVTATYRSNDASKKIEQTSSNDNSLTTNKQKATSDSEALTNSNLNSSTVKTVDTLGDLSGAVKPVSESEANAVLNDKDEETSLKASEKNTGTSTATNEEEETSSTDLATDLSQGTTTEQSLKAESATIAVEAPTIAESNNINVDLNQSEAIEKETSTDADKEKEDTFSSGSSETQQEDGTTERSVIVDETIIQTDKVGEDSEEAKKSSSNEVTVANSDASKETQLSDSSSNGQTIEITTEDTTITNSKNSGSSATSATVAETQKVDDGLKLSTEDQLNTLSNVEEKTSTAPLADDLKLETTTVESSILETTTPNSANVDGLNGAIEQSLDEKSNQENKPQPAVETETNTLISEEKEETSSLDPLITDPTSNVTNEGSKIVNASSAVSNSFDNDSNKKEQTSSNNDSLTEKQKETFGTETSTDSKVTSSTLKSVDTPGDSIGAVKPSSEKETSAASKEKDDNNSLIDPSIQGDRNFTTNKKKVISTLNSLKPNAGSKFSLHDLLNKELSNTLLGDESKKPSSMNKDPYYTASYIMIQMQKLDLNIPQKSGTSV